MGYCVSMKNIHFFVEEKDKYAAYRAFKKSSLAAEIQKPIYCIEDAFAYYGYTAENDNEDNIICLRHTAEKLGNEAVLFSAIAPYVKSGSFIEMTGEDNQLWRWIFTDGTLKKIEPKVEWC